MTDDPSGRLIALRAVLEEIANGDDHCACEHDDENCCATVGYFCPRCVAAQALKADNRLGIPA